MDKKRILTAAIALGLLCVFYLGFVTVTGTSPGLFLPAVLFALAWRLSHVISEGIASKDQDKWGRTVATAVGVSAAVLGIGFLVIVMPFQNPIQFGVRSLGEVAFDSAAVYLALRLRRA